MSDCAWTDLMTRVRRRMLYAMHRWTLMFRWARACASVLPSVFYLRIGQPNRRGSLPDAAVLGSARWAPLTTRVLRSFPCSTFNFVCDSCCAHGDSSTFFSMRILTHTQRSVSMEGQQLVADRDVLRFRPLRSVVPDPHPNMSEDEGSPTLVKTSYQSSQSVL